MSGRNHHLTSASLHLLTLKVRRRRLMWTNIVERSRRLA